MQFREQRVLVNHRLLVYKLVEPLNFRFAISHFWDINVGEFAVIFLERIGYMPRNVALFTNARDEPHIREWAAHHLLLGFTQIYIFDHESKTPIAELVAGLDSRVVVERVSGPNPVKLALMRRAVAIAKAHRVEWMMYLDADEFLCIAPKFRGIRHLLRLYEGADQLGINWCMFGTNNHVIEPEGLLMSNFTRSEPGIDQHVKSIVRPGAVVSVTNPHFFNVRNPLRLATITGHPFAQSLAFTRGMGTPVTHVRAFVAHYHYQSEAAYKRRKVARPQDDGSGNRPVDADIHLHHNDFENRLLADRYAALVATKIQK